MEIPGASCRPASACMDSPNSLSQCPGQQAECPPSALSFKLLHFSSDATYPDVRATIITTAVEQTSSHVPGQALGSGVKAHATLDGQDQVTSTALGKRASHSWARDSSDALATTARGSWLAAVQEDDDQQHSSGPTHLGSPPGRCDALVSAVAHSLEQEKEIVTAQAAELPSRQSIKSSTSSPVLALAHGFSSSSSRGSTSSRPAPGITAFLLIDEDLPPLAHAKSVSPKASSIGKRVNITRSVSNHAADSMPVHQAPDQGLHQPAGPGPALRPGPSDSIVENDILEPPRQPASSLLVSPFAMAGMKSILGKKGSTVGLQSQRSAPAPTQHLLRAGSADAIPSLSHSKTSRLARAGSAASSVFCVEGGPFAAVALKRAATTGMELQQRMSHDPPTVSSHASYGSELSYPHPSTPLPCDATARTAVQEGLRGRCSLQPPPPLDDEAEDALNSFLRDRCDAVSNYPSIEADTTLTTTTDVGSTQTVAPAWHAGVSFKLEEGYMEGEEGALAEAVAAEATEQEVQEEETVAQGGGDSDEDYSFDEDDEDEDGTTTVMPASRSELAAARLEISKLQEELGEQKALNSGLRGELRKFTALAARLTAQLQPDKAGTAQAAAGAATATVVSVASSECDAPVHAAMAQAAGPAPAVVCSMTTSHMEFPGTPAGAGPEAAAGAGEESGLKPWNRLALYREFLASSADLACGTMKEELLATQEVLHGKAELEPSSEQLFLSQLQKVLAIGASAVRLLSLQQQELE